MERRYVRTNARSAATDTMEDHIHVEGAIRSRYVLTHSWNPYMPLIFEVLR